jgi:hypothetical protein
VEVLNRVGVLSSPGTEEGKAGLFLKLVSETIIRDRDSVTVTAFAVFNED